MVTIVGKPLVVVVAVIAAGCAGRRHVAAPVTGTAGDELTLYRDAAFVHQRIDVDIAPAQLAHVHLAIAKGIDADDVVFPDRGALDIKEVHATAAGGVTQLEIIVGAPHAGHFAVQVRELPLRFCLRTVVSMFSEKAPT